MTADIRCCYYVLEARADRKSSLCTVKTALPCRTAKTKRDKDFIMDNVKDFAMENQNPQSAWARTRYC